MQQKKKSRRFFTTQKATAWFQHSYSYFFLLNPNLIRVKIKSTAGHLPYSKLDFIRFPPRGSSLWKRNGNSSNLGLHAVLCCPKFVLVCIPPLRRNMLTSHKDKSAFHAGCSSSSSRNPKKKRKKKRALPPQKYNTQLIHNLDGAFRDRRVK